MQFNVNSKLLVAILDRMWRIFLEDGLSMKENKEKEWKERGMDRLKERKIKVEKKKQQKAFSNGKRQMTAFQPTCPALSEARKIYLFSYLSLRITYFS